MRFAPRIERFRLSNSFGLTATISSGSVIVWGIMIDHDDASSTHSIQFSKSDGTRLFSLTGGNLVINESVVMDIPFLVDGGLTVTIGATTDTVNVIVFMSNVGA